MARCTGRRIPDRWPAKPSGSAGALRARHRAGRLSDQALCPIPHIREHLVCGVQRKPHTLERQVGDGSQVGKGVQNRPIHVKHKRPNRHRVPRFPLPIPGPLIIHLTLHLVAVLSCHDTSPRSRSVRRTRVARQRRFTGGTAFPPQQPDKPFTDKFAPLAAIRHANATTSPQMAQYTVGNVSSSVSSSVSSNVSEALRTQGWNRVRWQPSKTSHPTATLP